MHPAYVCLRCHGPLADCPGELRCQRCGERYAVDDAIVDFCRDGYYDEYSPGQALPREHLEALADELSGAESRVRDFYLPLVRDRLGRSGNLRVLDCGCGNGASVDLLNEAGLSAWGVDPSPLRRWQWQERHRRDRLSVADGSKLPFPDGFFDAVISSGVLEHIGVVESNVNGYRVDPAEDRDEKRRAFLRELIRVRAPGGRIWLDFPNGAFPIDFWHGTTARRGARFHPVTEGFLPTLGEVREYLAGIDPRLAVQPVGPHHRLRFRRVRTHWYGRLFHLPARALLRVLSLPAASSLAGTRLNPFLVLEIRPPASD